MAKIVFMKLRILIAFVVLFVAGRSGVQTISIAASTSDTVCYRTSVTFTATVVGTATYGYSWKVNGVPVGTSSATYTTRALRTGKDTVFCFLTNVAGDTILARSDTILMTVDSLPVIRPITGLDSVCIGDSLLLHESTTGGVWSSSNTLSATVSALGEVYGIAPAAGGGGPFGGGGGVRIDYSMANSCGADTVRFRFNVNIPAGPITGPGSICMTDTILFADTAGRGIWTTSDTTIANFLGGPGTGLPPLPVLKANTAGTVTVYFNAANACGIYSDSATIIVINCDTTTAAHIPVITSLAEAVNIFPNPNTGTFTVSLSGKYAIANCTITNIVGEKVKEVALTGGSQAEISMDGAGIYLVSITAGNEKYTTKVLVIQ